MLQILITEFPCMVLAFCIGLYSFRYMNLLYRIFFFQMSAYLLIAILAQVVRLILLANNMPLNNQWVYNLYMPIETGLLAWAGYEYFKENRVRFLIFIGYATFLLVFILELGMKGIWVFSNHGYVAESMLLLILYLFFLYSTFRKENDNWKRSPELWVCLGIVLYLGGVVPYISLIHYLQESNSKICLMLFHFIIVVLSQVRYLSLAAGFWLIRRNTVAQKLIPNE